MPVNILCVDDNADAVDALKLSLELEGDKVTVAMNAKDAMLLVERNQYDLFILDTHLPDKSGMDLCRWIRAVSKDIPIVIYSGSSQKSDIDGACLAGATRYLIKPAELKDILSTIEELTKRVAINQ